MGPVNHFVDSSVGVIETEISKGFSIRAVRAVHAGVTRFSVGAGCTRARDIVGAVLLFLLIRARSMAGTRLAVNVRLEHSAESRQKSRMSVKCHFLLEVAIPPSVQRYGGVSDIAVRRNLSASFSLTCFNPTEASCEDVSQGRTALTDWAGLRDGDYGANDTSGSAKDAELAFAQRGDDPNRPRRAEGTREAGTGH